MRIRKWSIGLLLILPLLAAHPILQQLYLAQNQWLPPSFGHTTTGENPAIPRIVQEIEITSWKARACGIFTRVGEVSEIEQVSAANEWDFWYFTNKCENPVQSAFHAVICLFYTYWDFRIKFCCVKKHFGFYFDQSERLKDFFALIAKFDAKISVRI